jgi:hypothetical protein
VSGNRHKLPLVFGIVSAISFNALATVYAAGPNVTRANAYALRTVVSILADLVILLSFFCVFRKIRRLWVQRHPRHGSTFFFPVPPV